MRHCSRATSSLSAASRSSPPPAPQRRGVHTARGTLAGARAQERTSPSPVVVFSRHRSKHYRDPDDLHAYGLEREENQQLDQDPAHRKRIEDSARAYFRNTFAPLDFPSEVAMRMLTHASYRGGQYGHNTRLSFVGEFCARLPTTRTLICAFKVAA